MMFQLIDHQILVFDDSLCQSCFLNNFDQVFDYFRLLNELKKIKFTQLKHTQFNKLEHKQGSEFLRLKN